MDRDQIIKEINSLNLDLNELWVTSSAALVLHGVKSNARDIDLGCSLSLWNELILKGYKSKQFEDGAYVIGIKPKIEIIKEYYVEEIVKVEGIKVGSLDSIKKQKLKLGRKKDLKDIDLIDGHMGKVQNGQAFWESEYTNNTRSVFGKPSKEVFEVVKSLNDNSRILDVACGDGRHSIFSAMEGHSVDAFDISDNAINNLKSKINNLDIRVCKCELNQYIFKKKYDLIIAHGILQFIDKNDRDKFIKTMKENTKYNGYNIIAVFTDAVEVPKDLEKHLIGIFREEEIKNYYDDWEIVLFESYVFDDEHENGLKHTHAINKLVARKVKLINVGENEVSLNEDLEIVR